MQTLTYDVQVKQPTVVEQRAHSKYLTNAQKQFKQLIRQLEDQFDNMKTQISQHEWNKFPTRL